MLELNGCRLGVAQRLQPRLEVGLCLPEPQMGYSIDPLDHRFAELWVGRRLVRVEI